ncbi:MAG: SpoIID/LytB domain-containing protein [Patescibacteria group bacterium]
MDKKNYTSLFGVVMVLVLLPFLPSYLISLRDQSTAEANTFPAITESQYSSAVTMYTSSGYVGSYIIRDPAPGLQITPEVLGVSTTRAAPHYAAKEVDRSNAVVNVNPDQSVTVWVDFLNTGNTTWWSTGTNSVTLRTFPNDRTSAFANKLWPGTTQPARLLQSSVRPGEIGRFRIALQAPTDNGLYLEEYRLVINNIGSVDGGYVRFPIGVGQQYPRPPDYQAQEINRSVDGQLHIKPGDTFVFWIRFKNSGLQNWYNAGNHYVALNVTDPVGHVSLFQADLWNEYYYRPTRLEPSRVYPGEGGRFAFIMTAPNVDGYYTEHFGLVAENLTWIKGGEFTLDIKVGNPPDPAPTVAAEGEPNVRVGLYSTTDPVTISCNGAYQLVDGNTNAATDKAAGETTTVSLTDTSYYRFVPKDASSILTVTSWTNKPVWNSTLNDNAFRGTLEVRYASSDKKLWIINELPLESYLKGLAEVANGQPPEYLKALITSARSYALWHTLRGGKHPDEHFDINATTDQVYRGYGFEQRSTDPLAAVQATAGMVITHPDAISVLNPDGIIVAAYSSGTDGRTRSWDEVWDNGGFPWCLSVADPYGIISNATTLEGNHMVGLSAQGARGYATKEQKTYDWILQYYYTGVTLKKIY